MQSRKPETLPLVVEHLSPADAPDFVRVEKSLHSIGYFASATKRPETSRTVIQIFRRPDGQKIHAKAVIEGVPSLGLPTTGDRDKYMAFMKIALDQCDFKGEVVNPIRFTGADMIKLLRLRKGGFHYDEINDWCKRLVATTIFSEAAVYLADRKKYARDTFHVFDRVILLGEELTDGTKSEHYQVFLSDWQIQNLKNGYQLPLDFNAYLRLKRDISKALFGHLSVWFFASRGQSVEKRYPDLCQLLNICQYPFMSKAKAVIGPSMDELVDIGYLASWDLVRTTRGMDFKLVMTPGMRLLSLPHFGQVVNAETKAALDAHLPAWVGEIVKRGVVERKARNLALDVPDDQPVMDQIEYAEYLIHQGRGKITNPAGFLIWVVENNLSVPPDFETSRKKELREAREADENEERFRRYQLRDEYERHCERQVENRLNTEYVDDRLQSALREQLKIIRRELPDWYQRVTDANRMEMAMARLRSQIREQLNFPTFEQWSRSDSQQRLF